MGFETPQLNEVLKDAIEARLCDLHTALPGEIVDYDSAAQTATVKPTLKRKYTNGDIVELPVINKVPVMFPRSSDAYFHFPLEKGHGVLLLFSERSIDNWKGKGGIVDPKDPRKHALSDAIAIPGLFASTSPISPAPPSDKLVIGKGSVKILVGTDQIDLQLSDNKKVTVGSDIVLQNGATSKVTVKSSGKVKVENATGELVTLVSQLLDAISTATTATLIGPQPLVMPTFAALKTQLDSFKE